MPHSTSNSSGPPLSQNTPEASDQPTTTNTAPDSSPPPAILPPNPSLRTLNRRRTYLTQHRDYFANPDLEYINPLLYDRCVRAFLSAEDREAAGKERGWSAVLEAGLRRGEARLERLRERDMVGEDEDEDEGEDVVRDKEEGDRIWREVVGERFLKGEDEDFDYGTVDGDEALDIEERRDNEEVWFDGEEESAVGAEGQTGIQDF